MSEKIASRGELVRCVAEGHQALQIAPRFAHKRELTRRVSPSRSERACVPQIEHGENHARFSCDDAQVPLCLSTTWTSCPSVRTSRVNPRNKKPMWLIVNTDGTFKRRPDLKHVNIRKLREVRQAGVRAPRKSSSARSIPASCMRFCRRAGSRGGSDGVHFP